ncbi:MOSC domain-containing protein [Cryptosporangium phraense]|uniref:MOSC domain-containing protein n=1 Tax=Cryptosporangium phraense TaxID=2593070 RepID=A0A545AHG5_9ACTN|nr:MOSC domain-containing protein [Cryptosporangium phraense]TQS40763.1 MOSC domain-containing protein [Cryptosporangium phraense]
MSSVLSVNIGVLRVVPWTQSMGSTGIDKRPVAGRVRAVGDGLESDVIVDTKNHGGYDQAVYAYAREDAEWWEAEIGRELSNGAFGENLTVQGVSCTDAVIGERWRVGSTLLEVSRPRIPCRTFAGFWDVPNLVKRFTQHGAPGAYLRIIEEGDVGAGDAIEVVGKPAHGVTIGEVFRALTGDRSLAPRLLEAPELPAALHERAHKMLTPASRR